MANTRIVLNRQSDLILTGATITSPIGLEKGDISELVADLIALGLADSAEAVARANGDTDLQAALTAAETALNAAIIAGDNVVMSALEAYQVSNDAALAAEEEARSTADSSLQSEINAEEARAEAAEQGLANDIEALEVEQAADVATLQSNIDNEQSRAEAAEAVLRSDLAKEVSDRTADVNAEEDRAKAAEVTLTADLSAETARAKAAEKVLTDNLSAEKVRAEGAEAGLQSNINLEKGRIDAILLASDADKDSFAEIVSLINSVDTTNDQAFASYVLSNDAALAAEKESREDADADLASDLVDEKSRAMGVEAGLAADISEEIVRATGEEDAIKASLAAEHVRAEAAEKVLTDNLSAEIENRTAADTAFTNSLNNEIADRIAGDQTVQSNLDIEVTRATAAESVLRTDLATEVSSRVADVNAEEAARIAGDLAIQTELDAYQVSNDSALAAETTARELADSTLDSEYKAADAAIDAAYKAANLAIQTELDAYQASNDSALAQEVSDRKSVVDTVTGSLNAYKASNDSALASETTRATAAEEAIAADLAAYELSNDAALAAGLASEHQHHIDGDAAVTTAFEAADATLQSNIDVETGRIDAILLASNADKDSFAEIVTLINSVDTTNDESFASYVLSNNAALAAELVAREAADGVLQTNLDEAVTTLQSVQLTEKTDREAADGVLQTNLDEAVTTLQSAIAAEAEARDLADRELDDKIADIISNVDVTAIDSFTETIAEVNAAFDSAYTNSYNFTIDNRPSMLGFNESPEMLSKVDGNGEAIMVLRNTFTSRILKGTHIVFLNGLMLLEGADYSINSVVGNLNDSYLFTEAPALTDKVNIYGVLKEDKRPEDHTDIGSEDEDGAIAANN